MVFFTHATILFEISCFQPQSTLRGPSSDNEDSELPWCVICNGNAQLRCVDEECEGALYCSRCFKEDHSDSDMRHHRTVKYSK